MSSRNEATARLQIRAASDASGGMVHRLICVKLKQEPKASTYRFKAQTNSLFVIDSASVIYVLPLRSHPEGTVSISMGPSMDFLLFRELWKGNV